MCNTRKIKNSIILALLTLLFVGILFIPQTASAADNVCKIGSTGYPTLQAAIDAISAGTATNTGTADSYKIEMLVPSYEIAAEHTFPAGKTIELTTAASDAATLPYTGAAGTTAMLKRASSLNAPSMIKNNGILNLDNITIDGGAVWTGTTNAKLGRPDTNSGVVVTQTMQVGMINSLAGSTLNLNENTIIQNNAFASNVDDTSTILVATGATMNVNGAILRNNYGGRSGAVYATGGNLNFNSGEVYGNKANYGGAFYGDKDAVVTVNDGTIHNNWAINQGGAIRNFNGTIKVTGGTIYNNYCDNGGAIYNISGTVDISGSPTIWDNFKADGTTRNNILLPSGKNITVSGDLTNGAKVGVTADTSRNTLGKQFGTTTATSASTVSGLDSFVNDVNDSLVGSAGTGTAVVWAKPDPVCKIGNVGYTSLQKAIDAINDGSATDTSGATGTDKTDYKIEMLVTDYNLTQTHSIAGAKTVELTTADANASTLPFRGEEGGKCTLKRTFNSGRLFQVVGNMTISNIIVDGGAVWTGTEDETLGRGRTNTGIAVINRNSQMFGVEGNLTLNDGAIVQNQEMKAYFPVNTAVYTADRGVFAGVSGTLTINDGAVVKDITNSTGSDGDGNYGAGADGIISTYYAAETVSNNKHEFIMNGGTITGCETNRHGVIIRSQGGPTTINGGLISNNLNTGTGNDTGIIVAINNVVNLNGGTITNNKMMASTGTKAGAVYWYNPSAINVKGNPVVTGNELSDGQESNVYLKSTSNNITVTGDLTDGANVGVTADTTRNDRKDQFGISTAASASTVNGLDKFKNDINKELYGMAGEGNKVIWGPYILKIGKTVTGDLANARDLTANYTFTIKVKNAQGDAAAGELITGLDTTADVTLNTNGEGTITVTGGGENQYYIAPGYTVTVTESNPALGSESWNESYTLDGGTAVDITSARGSIPARTTDAIGMSTDRTVAVTNEKVSQTITGVLVDNRPYLGVLALALLTFAVYFGIKRRQAL